MTTSATTPPPLDSLSDREQAMLFLATDEAATLAWEDERDFEEFLDLPSGEPMPRTAGGRTLSVVNRILAARARGEHIL